MGPSEKGGRAVAGNSRTRSTRLPAGSAESTRRSDKSKQNDCPEGARGLISLSSAKNLELLSRKRLPAAFRKLREKKARID